MQNRPRNTDIARKDSSELLGLYLSSQTEASIGLALIIEGIERGFPTLVETGFKSYREFEQDLYRATIKHGLFGCQNAFEKAYVEITKPANATQAIQALREKTNKEIEEERKAEQSKGLKQ